MRARLMHNGFIIMAIVAILWPISSFSQNTVVKHYSVSDGMPSSECYDVIQDSKGYMWIGTDAGVVRYDGYRFKTYNNSNGLVDNTVFKILEDKNGKVWFLTYSGRLFYYLYDTDSIYGIPANKLLSNEIKRFPIEFIIDDSSTFYISNYCYGYITVSEPYTEIRKNHRGDNMIYIKEFDENNFIYGHDFQQGQRPKEMGISFRPNKPDKNFNDTELKLKTVASHISAVKLDQQNYLITDGTSIIKVNHKGKQILLDSVPEFRSVNGIISLYKDKENRIWISTMYNGCYVYESAAFNKVPQHFLENLSVSN